MLLRDCLCERGDLDAEVLTHLLCRARCVGDDDLELEELLAESLHLSLDGGGIGDGRSTTRRSGGERFDLPAQLMCDVLDPGADVPQPVVERCDLALTAGGASRRLTDDAGERADPVAQRLDCIDEPVDAVLERWIHCEPGLRTWSSSRIDRSASSVCTITRSVSLRTERSASLVCAIVSSPRRSNRAISPSFDASPPAVVLTVLERNSTRSVEHADLLVDPLLEGGVFGRRGGGFAARAACSETAWRPRSIAASFASVRSSPFSSASVSTEILPCSATSRPAVVRTMSPSVSTRSVSVVIVSRSGSDDAAATAPDRPGASVTNERSASSSPLTDSRAAAALSVSSPILSCTRRSSDATSPRLAAKPPAVSRTIAASVSTLSASASIAPRISASGRLSSALIGDTGRSCKSSVSSDTSRNSRRRSQAADHRPKLRFAVPGCPMIEGNRICIAVSSRQRHPSSEGFTPAAWHAQHLVRLFCGKPGASGRCRAADPEGAGVRDPIRALSHDERMTFKARAFPGLARCMRSLSRDSERQRVGETVAAYVRSEYPTSRRANQFND